MLQFFLAFMFILPGVCAKARELSPETAEATEIQENPQAALATLGYGSGTYGDAILGLLDQGLRPPCLAKMIGLSASMLYKYAKLAKIGTLKCEKEALVNRLPQLLQVARAVTAKDQEALWNLGQCREYSIFTAGLPAPENPLWESLKEVQLADPAIYGIQEFGEIFLIPYRRYPKFDWSIAGGDSSSMRSFFGDWVSRGIRSGEQSSINLKNVIATKFHQFWQSLKPEQKEKYLARYIEKKAWIKKYNPSISLAQNIEQENERLSILLQEQLQKANFQKVIAPKDILGFIYTGKTNRGLKGTFLAKLFLVSSPRMAEYLKEMHVIPAYEQLRLYRVLFAIVAGNASRVASLLHLNITQAKDLIVIARERLALYK